jgi:hypothetical protein
MPFVFDATFMETTQIGNYDRAAEEYFGDNVIRLGLPRPDSWRKFGWKSAPGDISDYLLEVGDIGIVGGFEAGFDWDEHPFAEYGVYVWPVTTKAEVDANPKLTVLEAMHLWDHIRSAGNHRAVIGARLSQNHHATAYVSFDRKVEIVGDTIFYRLGNLETTNVGAADANGEHLELAGAYAAASIQIRADWAALLHYVETANQKAKVIPVIITERAEPTATDIIFYELMRVAIDQLYDNHSYREEVGEDMALDFDEPQLTSSPCWNGIPRQLSRERSNEIVLAEPDAAFQKELTYHCNVVERLDRYDAVSGLLDIQGQAEGQGNDKLLGIARKLLIKLGFYRIMPKDEIASTVTLGGRKPWNFRIEETAYTSDYTIEDWSLVYRRR